MNKNPDFFLVLQQCADRERNPKRGESNHLTHCSQDNGANVEIIGLRIDLQDTFSFNTINKCMW